MTDEEQAALEALAAEARAAEDLVKRAVANARRIRAEQEVIRVAEDAAFEELLASFAAKSGMTLAEIKAIPDEPRMNHVENAEETPLERALNGSGVPDRFRALLRATQPLETPPLRDVRAWLASTRWGIALAGPPGIGKTVAAVVGLVEAGGGLFVTAEELAAPTNEARELADRAQAAAFLIVDELGDEALTDIAATRIRGLIGTRHKGNRRTVLTTNLDEQAFTGTVTKPGRYGSRIGDWLREGAGFKAYNARSLRGAA